MARLQIIRAPRGDIDLLAKRLMHFGAIGASMPPTWDGGKHSPLVAGQDGAYIGRMLPGKGFRLGCDLKTLGITQPLPYVYEDTTLTRLWDYCKSQQGAVTTYAELLTARGTYKHSNKGLMYLKDGFSPSAFDWYSLYQQTGMPGAGSFTAFPGGAAHNSASSGSILAGMANPTAPDKAYLISLGVEYINSNAPPFFLLNDLLVALGGIDTNSNAAQTLNSTALTRYTSGSGVMMTLEVDSASALGNTNSNVTITKYTNQSGTALQASPAQAMVTSAGQRKVMPVTLGPWMQLQTGDYGVRSVEEIQLSAAMGTAGRTVALVLYYPLAFIPIPPSGSGYEWDLPNSLGVSQLVAEAGGALGCLNLYVNPTAVTQVTSVLYLQIGVG